MSIEPISLIDLITLFALVAGPIGAVVVTKISEARREKRQRKLDVFRTLMRTRRWQHSPDHVGALNLVEIEFHDDRQVIEAWRRLFDHFGRHHPRREDEEVSHNAPDNERAVKEERYTRRINEERQRLLTQLLHAMARALGFQLEQLEIFEGGYIPQGWGDLEWQQEQIRRFAIDLASGQRVVPVGVVDYTSPRESSHSGNGESASTGSTDGSSAVRSEPSTPN